MISSCSTPEVIFTNKSNIERRKNKRPIAMDFKIGRLDSFMKLVEVLVQVFIACGVNKGQEVDHFRFNSVVIVMPEQMRVGEFLPPYYISHFRDSIIISKSFSFSVFRILCAWDLQVDDGEVSSYRQLFTIPYPREHELKLLGFNKDKQPIVEAAIFQ
nr:F-box domain-containing protein [Tanacetum cinerariifolium]